MVPYLGVNLVEAYLTILLLVGLSASVEIHWGNMVCTVTGGNSPIREHFPRQMKQTLPGRGVLIGDGECESTMLFVLP